MSDAINDTEELSRSEDQNNQLTRYSEVTELIDSKPGFLIRWGITLLFLAFMLILSATWFIQYPDTIIAKGTLKKGDSGTDCYIEAVIPGHRFAKVSIGQKVFLKFEDYPYPEFGSVTGRVESISNLTTDGVFEVKISLPNGLITNYSKSFSCRTGLSAEADIIIGNRRLLALIFEKRQAVIK